MNSKIQNDIKELVSEQTVMGSILVGLGVILILAHNWDDFSRSIKTIFAFLPLVIGQILVGYSILKSKSTTWKEASGVFLFFAIGSSIALVSQIYNIPGELSNYLLTWVLLALPLIYLLKSNALGVLHIIFTTYYVCEYGYFNGSLDAPWLYIVLILAVVPLYKSLIKNFPNANITSIFNWLIPLSVIIAIGAFIDDNEIFIFLVYVFLFSLLYNIGKLPYFNKQKLRRNGYLILGSLGTIFVLLLTSFEWIWDEIFNEEISFNSQGFYISLVLFLSTLGVVIYNHINKHIIGFNLFQYVFIIFPIIFFIGLTYGITSMVLINILLLILGVMAIKIGVDKFHFGVLNYGLIIISVLIVCRFFDTNISFIVRGLLFVIIGVAFFLINYVMLKKQKKNKH